MSQPSPQSDAPGASDRKKKPLLIAAGAAAILSAAGVAALTMESAVAEAGTETASAAGTAEGDGGGHGSSKPSEHSLVTLEPFILNLADQDRDRYVRASIRVVFAGAEDAQHSAEGDPEDARMRDCILTILSSKRAEAITFFEGKEALRQELKAELATLLPGREVVDVLFTEFLVQ